MTDLLVLLRLHHLQNAIIVTYEILRLGLVALLHFILLPLGLLFHFDFVFGNISLDFLRFLFGNPSDRVFIDAVVLFWRRRNDYLTCWYFNAVLEF